MIKVVTARMGYEKSESAEKTNAKMYIRHFKHDF